MYILCGNDLYNKIRFWTKLWVFLACGIMTDLNDNDNDNDNDNGNGNNNNHFYYNYY